MHACVCVCVCVRIKRCTHRGRLRNKLRFSLPTLYSFVIHQLLFFACGTFGNFIIFLTVIARGYLIKVLSSERNDIRWIVSGSVSFRDDSVSCN